MNDTGKTSSTALRELLIERLRYPRTLINAGLELERCPHNGMYSDEDLRCAACGDAPECEWLYHNGEFAALTEKPIAELASALQFALLHVAALAASANHDVTSCDCPNCSWVRDSQTLLEQGGHRS